MVNSDIEKELTTHHLVSSPASIICCWIIWAPDYEKKSLVPGEVYKARLRDALADVTKARGFYFHWQDQGKVTWILKESSNLGQRSAERSKHPAPWWTEPT